MPQGRRFGKYLLHDKLAVGGMGELYLATVVGAAKGTPPSVLKILLPEYSSDADFVSMFHDEARLGMQLNHQNIVVVQDLGRVTDTPFLVMEYVHGENLRNVARRLIDMREKFPPDIAVRVMIEVLHGLEYAHHANDSRGRPINLVHRDLSPDNVMLSFDGDVKILDFGIAKAEGRATQTQFGILKGKAQYMAPEQALGQPVDERTDLYAIGLVLLEVLTGERRFGADVDPIQQIRDARTWKPVEPSKRDSSLPIELDAILLKSMQLDAKRRFQTAGEFADALTKLIKTGALPRSNDNIPRLMRRLFPDRAEPFLLFEEDSTAPKPDPRVGRGAAPPPPPPAKKPAIPSEPSIEIIEPTQEGSPESTRLGGGFLGGTGGNTSNPDAGTAVGVRPKGVPSNESTVPPKRGGASKPMGAFEMDDDRTNGDTRRPTSSFDDDRTNGGDTRSPVDDGDRTNAGYERPTTSSDDATNGSFDLDAPTQDSMSRKPGRGAAVPKRPSEAATENTGPGNGGGDLDDRTAVGTRPPPSSRNPPRTDDTIPPARRPAGTPGPNKAPPKFREAPPPPPAKFRDVKNLRDLPEVPSAGDEFMGDEVSDGTQVAGSQLQGPSRVSAAIDPPARIVERRRGDAAIPVAPRARKKKGGVLGKLVIAFFFLVIFGAGIGFGLLQSGRLPPEIQAQAETKLEPLFAAVPALRPKPRGTPTDRVATAGSGQEIAMNASPTPEATSGDGDDDDDDDDEASPQGTGRVMTGGGVFPSGDDDDDGSTAVAVATPAGTKAVVVTATPAPTATPVRTAVAIASTPAPTPKPTEKPIATPRPTREVTATPKPTAVASSAGKASVKVISTPPGVEILVDGQGTGKKTPATIQVEPGTRTIGLKMDGFRPWSFKEEFRAGDTLQLPVDLQPM